MSTKLHMIYARSANGVIGNKGDLPWHLPEDMAHFKRTTLGCPVIMGRKTWDSLPPRFRPLPGRKNIVITRQSDWKSEGALQAPTIEDALALCKDAADAWVIGGAQIYALAESSATTAVVTEIDIQVEGDAFAPTLGAQWKPVGSESHVSEKGVRYSFVTYMRE